MLLSFRPEASADVVEAFSWYDGQRAGLGEEFLADLDATLGLLQRMPESCPVAYRDLRRALLRHFPYAIYYATETVRFSTFAPCCISLSSASAQTICRQDS